MGQWPASLSLSFFLSLAVRRRDLGPRGWLLSNRKTHHMFALKRFLGVGQMTPNNMIYGDTARYPLYINAYVRAIRYWPKITRINEKRLPYKAYLLLLHLEEQGKNNWVTKIAQLCLDLVLGTYGRTREFRKLICLYVVLDKDSVTTAGRTGRVELMQAIDLIFTDNLRRIMCKQYTFQLILISI